MQLALVRVERDGLNMTWYATIASEPIHIAGGSLMARCLRIFYFFTKIEINDVTAVLFLMVSSRSYVLLTVTGGVRFSPRTEGKISLPDFLPNQVHSKRVFVFTTPSFYTIGYFIWAINYHRMSDPLGTGFALLDKTLSVRVTNRVQRCPDVQSVRESLRMP